MIGKRTTSASATLGVFLGMLACIDGTPQANADDAAQPWRAMFLRPAAPPPPANGSVASAAMVAAGAKLFADPRLSGSGQRSCASCHQAGLAFTDGLARPMGLSGQLLQRNTPTVWNLGWSTHFFWDGRAASLEAQVRGPIETAEEMNGSWPEIIARLDGDTDLASQLRKSPVDPVSPDAVVDALAAYVRSLVSPKTRFDAWIEGDGDALDAAEVRGFRLFTGKGGCVLCHFGWRFTDDRFHDIGLPSADPGRGAVAGGAAGLQAFKTPSLRELARTAPYMHDGSLPTLAAVVNHYAGAFVARPGLAPTMNKALRLSVEERADLVAFLGTLSADIGR